MCTNDTLSYISLYRANDEITRCQFFIDLINSTLFLEFSINLSGVCLRSLKKRIGSSLFQQISDAQEILRNLIGWFSRKINDILTLHYDVTIVLYDVRYLSAKQYLLSGFLVKTKKNI